MEPRFKDGTPVPDDEVIYNPDVDKEYGDKSNAKMDELRDELKKVKPKK